MAKISNDTVLSYYDCLLRSDDVDLLRGPYWLNDAIIGFYFEFLERHYDASNPKKLLFVSPELTQLLKLTEPSDYSILLDPLNATQNAFVFFPLNNCDKRDAAGGSHWSLMVFSRDERTSFHFDSSKGFNRAIAREFSKNIANYLLDGTERFSK